MKPHIKLFSTLLIAFALVGCATGPKYAEVKNSIPILSADKGRIFFYRSNSMIGGGIQPNVNLNGAVVGESKPGGFFYVDVQPANYEVSLTSEVEKKLTFAIGMKQERCVRMSVGLGVLVYRVHPELVEPATCETEIQDLSYTGSQLSK
jgi:hypothetical protein